MVILIAGASHTGKTSLAQRLLEEYRYPYISIDHLKMGLIRSKSTELTPTSDDKALTAYLWPVVREMIKTVIENRQNLVIEGCYIPFGWAEDFGKKYISQIRYCCLVMSESYIRRNYYMIQAHADAIEMRGNDSDHTVESLIHDNAENLKLCQQYGVDYFLIDSTYSIESLIQRFRLERCDEDV